MAREIAAGATDVRIQLQRGALVAGQVEGMAGHGSGLCWVRARRREGAQHHDVVQAICGDGGAFELRGLAPGAYELAVTTSDRRSGGLAQLVLSDGDERRGLRLPLARPLVISGKVVDLRSGSPLGGARVHGWMEQLVVDASTDIDGRFYLEGLARGVMAGVDVEAPRHLPNSVRRSTPVEGDTLDLGVVPLLAEPEGGLPAGPDHGATPRRR